MEFSLEPKGRRFYYYFFVSDFHMLFNVVYIFFVIATIFYGNLAVVGGFLTLRHIATLLMLALCIKEEKKLASDKYMNYYLLFIACFLVSSMVTGYLSDAIRFVLAFYFVCYVAYWSTKIMVQKTGNSNLLIYPLLVFGAIDAIVSINQVVGFTNIDRYIELMKLSVNQNYLDRLSVSDDFMGISVPGIMDNAVFNGEFLMIVTILSLYLQRKKTALIGGLLTIGLLAGSFYTQQRSPFFLALAGCLFICYKVLYTRLSSMKKIFITLPLVIALLYFIGEFMDFVNTGSTRFVDTSMTGREHIYDMAKDFIWNNLVFGGYYLFLDTTSRAPHNFFFNSFIYGGIVGGLSLIALITFQVIKIFRIFFSKQLSLNTDTIIMGSAYIAIVANSMVHNAGIVVGSVLAWLVWGAFEATSNIKTFCK